LEKINISKNLDTKVLKHFWNFCVGAGRANEGLRSNWQEHLQLAIENCGFEYLRFHGLLHDDMFVYKNVDGVEIYNYQYIDELFDRILDKGIRPFVELGFMPKDLASGEGTQFWWKGNITPPKDYDKWAKLIHNVVLHWISRYGLEEVKKWYFEVWNEPDLRGFWHGTKSQYFELYKVTVKAIKSIDESFRVGGPATSNFVPDDRFDGEVEDKTKHKTFIDDNIDNAEWEAVWVKDFVNYCEKEKLPVDFISSHPYPTDFALDGHGVTKGLSRSINATRDDLKWLRDYVDKSPYPNAEIHLTEWSSSPSPRDCSHDYLPAAAYVVKTNLDSTGLVDSLSYWVFTDVFEESGAGDSIFHGGFGLINFQGIVKPTFHAYKFLKGLGNLELGRNNSCIITKHSSSGKLSLLAYNYPEKEVPLSVPISGYPNRATAEKVQSTGSRKTILIELEDLKPNAEFVIETLDEDHGFALKMWKEMGQPEPPTREQTKKLREVAFELKKQIVKVDGAGKLTLELKLKPWNIAAINER